MDTSLQLVSVAVEPRGRRNADSYVVDEHVRDAIGVNGIALLDHAGPAAALWSSERAVAVDECVEPSTERRSRALSSAEWSDVLAAYVRASKLCAQSNVKHALVLDDDGLLHRAWSPLGRAGDVRTERVLEAHRACGGCDVVVCVEDLAPQGCDATDGLELARALVAQGAKRIYASAGSAFLPPLKQREKGTSTSTSASALLSSALWLLHRVDAEVMPILAQRGDDALSIAMNVGFSGCFFEDHAE